MNEYFDTWWVPFSYNRIKNLRPICLKFSNLFCGLSISKELPRSNDFHSKMTFKLVHGGGLSLRYPGVGS